MIMTVFALVIGAIIGVGTMILFALVLAHLENID
jgi:hypothetical protein